MRIHHGFILLSTFILMLLAASCTSDPKVETEPLPPASKEEKVIASTIETPPPAPAPTPEEIAAAEAEKIAKEKAETRKQRNEEASKERRRKRRAKRKKAAAEKAAAEKLARKEAAKEKEKNVPGEENTPKSYDDNTPPPPSAPEEDLSDIDPELLKVVQPDASGGTPRIRFDNESFNFGRIIQGKEIDHEFEFTNVGSAPLVINNVEVTCGCTTPFYPFVPIEPGKRGKISVHFSSKGRLGNQSPTITVYTNTDPGTFELYLKGIIDTEREGQ